MKEKNFIVLKDSIINVDKCLYIDKISDDWIIMVYFPNDEYVEIVCLNEEDMKFNWDLLTTELGSR